MNSEFIKRDSELSAIERLNHAASAARAEAVLNECSKLFETHKLPLHDAILASESLLGMAVMYYVQRQQQKGKVIDIAEVLFATVHNLALTFDSKGYGDAIEIKAKVAELIKNVTNL